MRTVAACAGSGASVLNGVKADLYITGEPQKRSFWLFNIPSTFNHVYLSGEMSHHEVLDAAAQGTGVLLSDHSNSERGFLAVFRERLAVRLPESVAVVVSKVDRDPLEVV